MSSPRPELSSMLIPLFSIGSSRKFSPSRVDRYISHFGPLNRRIEISNHSIILLDAPGLVEEDRQRLQYGYSFSSWSAKPNGPVDFVKKLSSSATGIGGKATVLFSHIPLSRPDGMDCGPLREKGSINQGWGLGYQNTLSEEATEFLLGSIRPSIIFRYAHFCALFSDEFNLVTAGTTMIIARLSIHYHLTHLIRRGNMSKWKKYR